MIIALTDKDNKNQLLCLIDTELSSREVEDCISGVKADNDDWTVEDIAGAINGTFIYHTEFRV